MKLLLEKDAFGTITVNENSHRSPGEMAHHMMVWCAPHLEYRVATDPHFCADELATKVWPVAVPVPATMFGRKADRAKLVAWATAHFCDLEYLQPTAPRKPAQPSPKPEGTEHP